MNDLRINLHYVNSKISNDDLNDEIHFFISKTKLIDTSSYAYTTLIMFGDCNTFEFLSKKSDKLKTCQNVVSEIFFQNLDKICLSAKRFKEIECIIINESSNFKKMNKKIVLWIESIEAANDREYDKFLQCSNVIQINKIFTKITNSLVE